MYKPSDKLRLRIVIFGVAAALCLLAASISAVAGVIEAEPMRSRAGLYPSPLHAKYRNASDSGQQPTLRQDRLRTSGRLDADQLVTDQIDHQDACRGFNRAEDQTPTTSLLIARRSHPESM